jgi:tetratricopeptide (TPR) repeat protein
MKCIFNIAISVLAIFFLSISLYSQTTASTELTLGAEAYRNARYEEAAHHFERAVALAPDNITAHLYLAMIFTNQYIPGNDVDGNLRMAELAIEHYQIVLDSDAERGLRLSSAKGIADLRFNMKQFDDAKKYDWMASGLDPKDPEPSYSIGVVD